MRWLNKLRIRVQMLLHRGREAGRLDAELQFHLEQQIAENIAAGMSAEEARYAALRSFGNPAALRDETREAWSWNGAERLLQDLRYALRQMRRSPGFAATVVGTLALGIGAAAAMFTVVDHVLLQPVNYRDPQRLVLIRETDGKPGGAAVPWLDIEEWRNESHSFEQIAFSSGMNGRNYLEGNSSAMEVGGTAVSTNLFSMLGVQPVLGREFVPETPAFGASGNAGTVVLSYGVWQQAFGGDRGVIGRRVRINNDAYTVVGVMPAGFHYPVDSHETGQVWTAIQLGGNDRGRDYNGMSYSVLGRLRSGATLSSAQAEMTVLQKHLLTEYSNPDLRKIHSSVRLERYGDSLVDGDTRKGLLALLAAAGVLWLIATVNVTNLLLARATARQREIAMRGALGASRGRVVQQMVMESLVLSGSAGLLGTGLALASVKLLGQELSQQLPLPAPATADGLILLVLLGMTVVSALLAATWPALMSARTPIEAALRQGSVQAGTDRRHHRMRGALVAAEVALSLALLVSCGLLLRTIYSLRHVPLGYRTDHIIVAQLNIPGYRYAGRNLIGELYNPLLERVRHLHGVESAGLMTNVPLDHTFLVQLTLNMNGKSIFAYLKGATPEMQKVLGFRMAAGRFFTAEDVPNSQPVVVVNEAFARQYSPDSHNPAAVLGKTLLNLKKDVPSHIVGILADERQGGVAAPAVPEIEICIPQITPDSMFYGVNGIAMDVAMRTERPVRQVIPELRAMLKQASPELEGATITTMDQIVADSYGSQRLAAHLLEIFGGSALLLCVAGLYGLLAYIVTQRTRELGVRVALGAPRGNLLWLVMRQAGAMLIVGVAAGTGLAWVSAKLVRGFLFGVEAHDGWTMAGAAVLLLISGLAAAYLPARRAAGVDPMEALRAE